MSNNNVFLTLTAYNISNVTSHFYIKNNCVGMGNMLFQIASALNYALKNNACLYVPCLNTYFRLEELQKENTIFRNINTNIIPEFNESNTIMIGNPTNYYILNHPFYNNIHFTGYFENFNNFDEIKPTILKYFSPTEKEKTYIFNKYPMIQDDFISSIHVRMGACVKKIFNSAQLLFIENSYFELIDYMINTKNINKLMVLTNDKDYCKRVFDNNEKYKNITFYYSNEKIDFIDMWIISLMKNNIISYSTFSLWGSYLNQNKDKFIVGSDKITKHIAPSHMTYKEWHYI